jgi:aspartyl protease family protein
VIGNKLYFMSALLALAVVAPSALATDIEVTGLFSNKAMVSINKGRARIMSAGQTSPEGVKLISANSSGAVFEVDGQRRTIGMGQSISTSFASSSKPTVKMVADTGGHFSTMGSINGHPIRFMVDTGATMVSFNTAVAQQMGIDLSKASQGAVSTAGGIVRSYRVMLDSVKVGDISMNYVEASIVDNLPGEFALLGNSFLSRVQMNREGTILTLTQTY